MNGVAHWFGTTERPLLGWYHAPEGAARDAAVVLCPPFGTDAVSSYRSYRALAIDLAAAGFPALRFDLDGTGDSAGSDRDPARVEAWLKSIRLAVDEARARSGAARVCLFGLRLGATLAVAAAARDVQADGLVLWAPLASGRAFARELKLLAQTAEPGVAAAAPLVPSPLQEGDMEAGGFLLTRETVEGLGRIDLGKLERSPAPAALVIARDDMPEDRKVPEALERLGVQVTQARMAGFAALMQAPHLAVCPRPVLDAICEWLSGRHPRAAEARPEAPAAAPAREPRRDALEPAREALVLSDGGGRVRERLVTIESQRGRLEGVLTEPEAPPPSRRGAIVLLNAGAVRRVGPNRMHVALARTWAATLGATTLRVDLGGLGDSDGTEVAEEHLYHCSNVAEVRAVIGHLVPGLGVERVLLAGLCSGAYAAFHTALVDPAVAEVVLINPQTFYFQPGASLDIVRRTSILATRRYGASIRSWQRWKRMLTGEGNILEHVRALWLRAVVLARDRLAALRALLFGQRENEVLEAWRNMQRRGVRAHLLYCAGDPGIEYIETYLGKELSRLPRGARTPMAIVPGPDHTFKPLWSQVWLSRWLTELASQWSHSAA